MASVQLLNKPPSESLETSQFQSQSAAHFSAIIGALPFACATFDHSGKLNASNALFSNIFPSTEISIHLDNFLSSFEACTNVPTLAQTPGTSSTHDAYSPTTGKIYRLTVSNIHINMVTAHLLCAIDASSDRKELVQQHELHERMIHAARTQSIGEMTTILSHELNQPLGSIINCLDTAKKALECLDHVPMRARDAIRLAQIQATQAATVVTRIREFVSTRQPKLELYSISSLISHGLELKHWEIQQHRVRLAVEIADSLPRVHIDPVMIGQVFSNLIQNGIDAMKSTPIPQRLLSVTVDIDLDQRIIVSVCDRGIGMTPEQQEKIFTPFYTTKAKGMGVGLALCRSIMEYHAGRLYFESQERRGSTFCFSLPT